MLTIGKILIIITFMIPILIGSFIGSIVSFIGAFSSNSILASNPAFANSATGLSISAGVWLLMTFAASIFSIIAISHL